MDSTKIFKEKIFWMHNSDWEIDLIVISINQVISFNTQWIYNSYHLQSVMGFIQFVDLLKRIIVDSKEC